MMNGYRTLGMSGATLALLAWSAIGQAQSVPRYPTPTPATPPTTADPPPVSSDLAGTSEGRSETETGGTTGTSQSTTRTPGSVNSAGIERSRAVGAGATSTTRTTGAAYDPNVSADTTGRPYRPNRPLMIIGSTMFLGSYATTAVVGAVSPLAADRNLFIPVAGPWLDLAERPCGFGQCDPDEDVYNAVLVGGGITQAAGLAILVASLFVPERDHERRSVAEKPTLRVAPVSFGRGGGLGAVGTF